MRGVCLHYLAALGAALLFGASSGGVSAGDGSLLQQIKQRGTLRIALEGTYPPFNFQSDAGSLVGFEVDLADALTKRLGVKSEFLPTKWDGILAGLDAGRYDVIMNEVIITPERLRKYDFTRPYTVSGSQIIVRKADQSRNSKPADLAGKRVGVGLGTIYESWLRTNVPQADVKTYDDDSTKYQDLRVGRTDAVIADRLVAGYLLQHSDGQLVASGNVFVKQSMGIALRKGSDDLRKALDKALEVAHKDGTFRRISYKWFGTDVSR